QHFVHPSEIAFAPDGKTLATCNEHGIVLWQTLTGRKLRTLPEPRASSVCFAPDSRTLFVASGPCVHVWDPVTGEQRYHYPGHEGRVHTVIPFPDGKSVL